MVKLNLRLDPRAIPFHVSLQEQFVPLLGRASWLLIMRVAMSLLGFECCKKLGVGSAVKAKCLLLSPFSFIPMGMRIHKVESAQ